MCKIIGESKRISFTGYKISLKIKNEYLSPSTGIKYKTGKIEKIINSNFIGSSMINPLIDKGFYVTEMDGNTSVFTNKTKAILTMKECAKNENLVVLKMKLNQIKYKALLKIDCFETANIIIGSHIDSFEEIKL